MTRTLFLLTCLAGVMAALTAFAIRWELAFPGVSLFVTADGRPDGHLFNKVAFAHRMLCFLTVTLLGTTVSSAARRRTAPLSGVFMWVGIAVGLCIACLTILSVLPPIGVDTADALYPPLSSSSGSVVQQLFPRLDPLALYFVTQKVAIPANAMLYLGVYAALATLPKLRFMSIVGLVTVAAAVALVSYPIQTARLRLDWLWIAALVVPFLIAAFISLTQERRPWLIVMTIGVVFTTLAPWVLVQWADGTVYSETMATIALQYLFPMGLAWFALPALMLFMDDTRLPSWSICGIPAVIAATLCLWIFPLFQLGRMGMPALYADYPDAFGPLNLIASIGVAVFALVYLAIIVTIRSKRA